MVEFHKTLIFILLTISFVFPQNSVRFDSERGDALYRKVSGRIKEPFSIDTLADDGRTPPLIVRHSLADIGGRKYPVVTEEEGMFFRHIGLALFPPEVSTLPRPVTKFIERLLLETLLDTPRVILEKNGADKISIVLNGKRYGAGGFGNAAGLVSVVRAATSWRLTLTIDEYGSKRYTATWNDTTGNEAVIGFPSRKDVIAGKDKRELDGALLDALGKARLQTREPEASPAPTDLQKSETGLFVKKGENYAGHFSDDRFYRCEEGECRPVVSERYPRESCANLLLGNLREGSRLKVALSCNDFSGNIRRVTAPLNAVERLLGLEHHAYIGFEGDTAGDTVAAVLVYVNTTYNLLTMVQVRFARENCRPGCDAVLPAVINPNIPNDNVRTLFGRYPVKKRKKFSVVLASSQKGTYAAPTK